MSIDRTKPFETKLRWVPLASDERPPPWETIVLWNPCDGIHEGGWDGERFYLEGEGLGGIGSCTHWAIIEGPQPSDDVNINWQLWQGGFAE